MNTYVLVAIIGFIQAVMITVISWKLKMFEKSAQKIEEKRFSENSEQSKIRAESDILQANFLSAVGSGVLALIESRKKGVINGNLDLAELKLKRARKKYYDFINHTAIKQLNKE